MDYPYLIFYIIIMFLAFQYWKTKNPNFAKWAFGVAFVFFAFRAPVVGADTWNYVRYLTGERNFYNEDPKPLEPLFIFYREIMCSLTSSRFIVMVVNTILSMAPLYYLIKKYSFNPPLSILFFCYLEIINMYFVALRQVLALSILFCAMIFCMESSSGIIKKSFCYIGCAIISYFIHTSAVMYAFVILVALIPLNPSRKIYYVFIAGSALLGFVLKKFDVHQLLGLAFLAGGSSTERLEGYLDWELNEMNQFSLLVRLSVIALISFYFMDKEKLGHPFSKLFAMGVVIFNLLYSVPMIPRIVGPMIFLGTITFTWVMGRKYIEKPFVKRWVNIIVVLVVLYFTRSQMIMLSKWDKYDESRMHPYYFIFQDYGDHPSIKYF